jgi:hypothetical protein
MTFIFILGSWHSNIGAFVTRSEKNALVSFAISVPLFAGNSLRIVKWSFMIFDIGEFY